MSAVLLGTFEPNTDEWHALRANGIGSSDIAAVVGLSPFTSAYTLWHRKAGKVAEQSESDFMDWGKRLEPVIADKFAENHREMDVEPTGTWCSSDRPWQRANPDRLIQIDTEDPDGIDSYLEVKSASAYKADDWGPSGTDRVPPGYRAQVIWQGDVLGLSSAWCAVLIGGNDYREYHLTWEADEAEFLREAGRVFWESIQNGEPPAIDGSDSTYEVVRQLHPDIDADASVEIPPELFASWEIAKGVIDEQERIIAAAKSRITDHMGDARYGHIAGQKVVIRQSTKTGLPYVKLASQKREAA
jgi:putative phage-type endonuclease